MRRARSIALSLFAIAGAIVTADRAAAAPAATTLVVVRTERASDCPTAAALVERTSAGARRPYVLSGAAMPLVVTFDRDGANRTARIDAPDGRRRTLVDVAERCDGLGEAVVLALTLSTDGGFDAPSPSADVPATHPPAARQAEALPSRHAPERHWSLRVAGGTLTAVGAIRPISFGVQLGVDAVAPSGAWSLGALASYVPPSEVTVGPGIIEVSLATASLEACARAFHVSPMTVEACARGEGGLLRGTARGFAVSESHDRPSLAAAAALRGLLGIASAASAFVELTLRVPPSRERFAVTGAGVAYDPPTVGIGAAAGLAWTFR